MDNVVTINNTKTNILELDVSVQGIDTADIRVWLSVLAEGIELCFECQREGQGEKWVVTVPPLPFITRTAYPCSVKIVADGYYFEPLTGTMNVQGSAEVYSTTPQNTEFKPADVPEEKSEEKEEVTEKVALGPAHQPKRRSREKSIQQIANELLERNKDGGVEGQADENNVIQIPVTKKAATAAATKIVEEEEDRKATEEAEQKATDRSKEIDELVENIRDRETKSKDLIEPEVVEEPIVEEVIEPVEEPIVEEVIEPVVEEVIEPEVVEEPIVEEVIEPVVDLVDEKIDEIKKDGTVKDIIEATKPKKKKRKSRKKVKIPKKEIADFTPPKSVVERTADEGSVKAIVEAAKKKAKKYTKKKKPVAKIPKKDIADFKLKPRKVETVIEDTEQTKNDAIKAILEDLGVKLPQGRKTKFIVRSKAIRGEDGYDIEEITKELIEKSELDADGIKKLEQLKEVVESEKDSEVMAILEEIGIKPKGSKNTPRVSFIKKDTH